ncbi:CapA family protein [Flavobacterium sp. 102]|uniref:CapA family protein n=1 Tax=Flavobacterium sp. 102 TaxID=2135623 RepID=UPI000EAE3758|nr:CapA family protein [Flavobacterium sp. 102]RKS01867.1 poly-gamma-glutamate synthesis protein (capsule biosynthesis protein) [Flavobacterium sp. 102]
MSYDILVCGDFYVGPHAGGRLDAVVANKEYALLFGELYEDLKASNLSIVNLEGPVVSSGNPSPKTGPVISMKPLVMEALLDANINLVTLANNHIMDFGIEGFKETLTRLDESNLNFVGAGLSKTAKRKPFITEIKSKKIAIINVCEHEWISDINSESGANGVDVIENFYQIKALRSTTDFIIVIYHGGNEYHPLPTPDMKKIFRFFVDAGASAVIGHHTHTFSGYEKYHDCPIFYSLGNFIFDSNKKSKGENWNTGVAIGLNVINDQLDFQIIPFLQNDKEIGIKKLKAQALQDFEVKLKKYSEIINDDQKLQEEYNRFAGKMGLQYLAFINPYEGKLSSLFKKGILPSVYSKKKILLLLNLIRCESHKYLLEHILKEKIKKH